jgi:hypothetical protein
MIIEIRDMTSALAGGRPVYRLDDKNQIPYLYFWCRIDLKIMDECLYKFENQGKPK